MLRATLRRLEHPHLASQQNSHRYASAHSRFDVGGARAALRFVSPRHWWTRYRRLGVMGKLLAPVGTLVLGFGAYVGVCTLVHREHRPAIDALFQPQEEYVLEDWAVVEPTLREGDIVLLMGTGDMSWKITNSQFVYAMMRPAALRYSHVAVVVEPAVMERWPRYWGNQVGGGAAGSKTGVPNRQKDTISDLLRYDNALHQRRQKRGALILEAVDNKDINAPDVNGVVRHDCVQVVEANRRITGREGERWCYNRFAVRRLKGFEWTKQRKLLLRQFIAENVGRPMDKSPLIMLAFIHPKLYEWTEARKGREISCSELIAELYKHCGVIERRWKWEAEVEPPAGAADDGHSKQPSGNSSSVTSAQPSRGGVVVGANDAIPSDVPEEVIMQNQHGSKGKLVSYFHRPSIQVAPFHFADGMEVGVLDFAEGVYLGPEVRMMIPHHAATAPTQSTTASTLEAPSTLAAAAEN